VVVLLLEAPENNRRPTSRNSTGRFMVFEPAGSGMQRRMPRATVAAKMGLNTVGSR
jgi:hypothetical protein